MTKNNALNIKAAANVIYGPEVAEKLLKEKYKDSEAEFFEPVPDAIGFKQHKGECVSDSIQEMILFADGLREFSQPIIHGITKEQVTTRSTMKLDYQHWAKIQDYFYYIQKRFRAHYAVINYLKDNKIDLQTYFDKYEEVCLLNPLFKQKEATSIEAGILALKHYKGEKIYTGGLNFSKAKDITDGLLKCLSLPYKCKSGVNTDAAGILVRSKIITANKLGEEELRPSGHATSFFKVMGKWAYYDDNRGLMLVDEKIIEALKEGVLRVVTYNNGLYFVKKVDGVYVSVWKDDKWNKDAVSVLLKEGKLKEGIHLLRPIQFYSVVYAPELLEDGIVGCNISEGELVAKTVTDLNAVLDKFRKCIYSNLRTNSKIFENMYKFLYENIMLVKQDPEVLAFVERSIKTVVIRPACSPFTHYWCSKIKMALLGRKPDSLAWFKLPKEAPLRQKWFAVPPQQPYKKRLDDDKNIPESEPETGSKSLTPCLPGQVRNMKTLKCKERVPGAAAMARRKRGSIKSGNVKERKPMSRKEKCPKGQIRDRITGICIEKPEKCPPGMVRDKTTGECRGRLEKNQCPEGQIFDKKTKKCRDPKGFKF